MDSDRLAELAQQPPLDGVVIRVRREGEQTHLDVTPQGDVRVTELPALLGLARKLSEERLGIGRG
jgi:hypothetical protein